VLKAMKVIGGLLGEQAVSAEEISALAKLPGRAYLQGQIVGTLQAPLAQIVGLFDAPFRNLVHVLTARSA
jgi:large subunit ribosomal protein L10